MAARSATELIRARRVVPWLAGRAYTAPLGALSLVAFLLGAALLGAPPCATSAHATAARSAATRTWTAVSTPNIEVLTDAGREVGERVAERLENLRTVLSLAAPALVVDVAPVQVIVFRDAALAETYAPTWRGQRDQVGGLFQTAPDRRRLLFQNEPSRAPAVAQHEFTHALLDAAMPEAPLWLNEGLAEYFSTFEAEGERARAGAPIKAHLEWLEEHDMMSLGELFAIGPSSAAYHEGDRRGTFYAQSWALTHMLLSGTDDDLGRLERVLQATREGERFASAFARVFGDDASLRERLLAYLDRPHFAVREWRLRNPLGPRSVRVRQQVPPAEVLGSLATALLARPTPRRELAEEHLREALAIDPKDPGACAGMGWLLLQRGQREQARPWFDRALEREPLSVPAVRLMASQLLLDAGARGNVDEREEVGQSVRKVVERARVVAPDDPELEVLLARTWVVAPGRDPSPGWPHAVRAAEALPGRPDVLLDQLALAALTGRDSVAWRIFESHFRRSPRADLVHSARASLLAGEVRTANRMLARGDAGGAEARLVAARERIADDAELVRDADDYLAQLRSGEERNRETVRENAAITEYNAGVEAGNAARFAEAAAAFRRAADGSGRGAFREKALRMAARMDMHARGARAIEQARAGEVAQAIAFFESVDRAALDDEDRRWLDRNLAQLRRMRAR